MVCTTFDGSHQRHCHWLHQSCWILICLCWKLEDPLFPATCLLFRTTLLHNAVTRFGTFLGLSCWPGTPPALILLRPRSPYVTGLFRQWPGCWDCFAPKVFGWERWILIPRQAAAPSSKRGFSPTRSSMRMDWQNVQNSWSLLQLKCFESLWVICMSCCCHLSSIYCIHMQWWTRKAHPSVMIVAMLLILGYKTLAKEKKGGRTDTFNWW